MRYSILISWGEYNMVITDVTLKNNKSQCIIYIDNIEKYTIDMDLVVKLDIIKGKIVDEDWINNLKNEIDYKNAYKYALRLLSVCDRTSSQIREKLLNKDFNLKVIEKITYKLTDLNYINDENYVEKYLKEKSRVPGMNKKTIFYKLLYKGIDRSLINTKLDEIYIDEYSLAIMAAEKKLRTLKGDYNTKKSRLYSYLRRKGYSNEICFKVINKVLKNDLWE